MKLTPLPVNTYKLCCTPVMFAHFVCALLSFCAHGFPAKYDTQEPGKIIIDCTLYGTFLLSKILW